MNTLKNYPGSKSGSGTYQFIINRIPPHKIYIEGFLGSGAILNRKRPAEVSIGIDRDPDTIAAHPPRPGCSFITGNFIDFLDQIDQLEAAPENIFIYLDPPYLIRTRKNKTPIYKFEMTEQDHWQLTELIKDRPEKIMISGYKSDLYDQQLGQQSYKWRCETFLAMTRAGSQASEHLWMNYPEPTELHDYSYLGSDYHERLRIKRKITRWTQRLERLPTLERAAILKAIEDQNAS